MEKSNMILIIAFDLESIKVSCQIWAKFNFNPKPDLLQPRTTNYHFYGSLQLERHLWRILLNVFFLLKKITSKNLLTATVKGLLARSYQTQVTELYHSFCSWWQRDVVIDYALFVTLFKVKQCYELKAARVVPWQPLPLI